MREVILRNFFDGQLSTSELRRELERAVVTRSPEGDRLLLDHMNESYTVTPEHLRRVCDAVIAAELPVELLHIVGFCLVSSDAFEWDGSEPGGERVSNVASDWSAPQINFPLTVQNVAKWRPLSERRSLPGP